MLSKPKFVSTQKGAKNGVGLLKPSFFQVAKALGPKAFEVRKSKFFPLKGTVFVNLKKFSVSTEKQFDTTEAIVAELFNVLESLRAKSSNGLVDHVVTCLKRLNFNDETLNKTTGPYKLKFKELKTSLVEALDNENFMDLPSRTSNLLDFCEEIVGNLETLKLKHEMLEGFPIVREIADSYLEVLEDRVKFEDQNASLRNYLYRWVQYQELRAFFDSSAEVITEKEKRLMALLFKRAEHKIILKLDQLQEGQKTVGALRNELAKAFKSLNIEQSRFWFEKCSEFSSREYGLSSAQFYALISCKLQGNIMFHPDADSVHVALANPRMIKELSKLVPNLYTAIELLKSRIDEILDDANTLRKRNNQIQIKSV